MAQILLFKTTVLSMVFPSSQKNMLLEPAFQSNRKCD